MKKILTIVGARPQFIKAAPVSQQLRKYFKEMIVHTGQHYDKNMSQLFFEELDIPQPDINLEIGSGNHGEQTGRMLAAIEQEIFKQTPDMVMVYGDTNSTIAGALAASKCTIPIVHVESGLRSFNRSMPEEINRVLTDRISDLLLCPTQTAVDHLAAEGITQNVYLTGDVMFDAALRFAEMAKIKSEIIKELFLKPKEYILVTCHRPQNTDDPEILAEIVDALIASGRELVFPVHPRAKSFLTRFGLFEKLNVQNVHLIEPVGYLDMIQLEKNAEKIVTDSGGVQKEAYFFAVPCITMRPETEWVETVTDGWNVLVDHDKEKIINAITDFTPQQKRSDHYGNGNASEKITDIIKAALG